MTVSLRVLLNTDPSDWKYNLKMALKTNFLRDTSLMVQFKVGGSLVTIIPSETPISTTDLVSSIQGFPQEVNTHWAAPLFGHETHATIIVEDDNNTYLQNARLAVHISLQFNPMGLLWNNGALIGKDIITGIKNGTMPDIFALFSIVEWADTHHIGLCALGSFEILGKALVMPLEGTMNGQEYVQRLGSLTAYLISIHSKGIPDLLPDPLEQYVALSLDDHKTYLVVTPVNEQGVDLDI
jgi:hypothetical protein